MDTITTAPELGLGCHSYNTIHERILNPLNPSLSAGGSSGGAAAALASKMVCLSDRSDMFGSLRNPAG
jgi:amidase